ncbi:hypothetical protein HMPREF3214_01302 [Alloscardovia omnicolens]|nr:hypothetical protein HMPREF3214_01302 [Alloscardovia omnicolens]
MWSHLRRCICSTPNTIHFRLRNQKKIPFSRDLAHICIVTRKKI